jgi:hypothetical protein
MTPRAGRRRSTKRQTASRLLAALRSFVTVPLVLRLLRRRRAVALALRGSPFALALTAALAALGLWRRRRARAAQLVAPGPPNESAPGRHIPSPPAERPAPPAQDAFAPNESAPGHHPSPDPEHQTAAPATRQPMD